MKLAILKYIAGFLFSIGLIVGGVQYDMYDAIIFGSISFGSLITLLTIALSNKATHNKQVKRRKAFLEL